MIVLRIEHSELLLICVSHLVLVRIYINTWATTFGSECDSTGKLAFREKDEFVLAFFGLPFIVNFWAFLIFFKRNVEHGVLKDRIAVFVRAEPLVVRKQGITWVDTFEAVVSSVLADLITVGKAVYKVGGGSGL